MMKLGKIVLACRLAILLAVPALAHGDDFIGGFFTGGEFLLSNKSVQKELKLRGRVSWDANPPVSRPPLAKSRLVQQPPDPLGSRGLSGKASRAKWICWARFETWRLGWQPSFDTL